MRFNSQSIDTSLTHVTGKLKWTS